MSQNINSSQDNNTPTMWAHGILYRISKLDSDLKKSPVSGPERRNFLGNCPRNKGMAYEPPVLSKVDITPGAEKEDCNLRDIPHFLSGLTRLIDYFVHAILQDLDSLTSAIAIEFDQLMMGGFHDNKQPTSKKILNRGEYSNSKGNSFKHFNSQPSEPQNNSTTNPTSQRSERTSEPDSNDFENIRSLPKKTDDLRLVLNLRPPDHIKIIAKVAKVQLEKQGVPVNSPSFWPISNPTGFYKGASSTSHMGKTARNQHMHLFGRFAYFGIDKRRIGLEYGLISKAIHKNRLPNEPSKVIDSTNPVTSQLMNKNIHKEHEPIKVEAFTDVFNKNWVKLTVPRIHVRSVMVTLYHNTLIAFIRKQGVKQSETLFKVFEQLLNHCIKTETRTQIGCFPFILNPADPLPVETEDTDRMELSDNMFKLIDCQFSSHDVGMFTSPANRELKRVVSWKYSLLASETDAFLRILNKWRNPYYRPPCNLIQQVVQKARK
ncbi:hypothetical protein BB560_002196 [Smittium megazygosporum]|uniref:Uncharacterized protein n=1 Tax=Smittium megazygosporum TaxID=133381 RepID=A0A2T9ZFF2_9FUNG|nr:hypothetical protein BB560_002198 [Smittium megazygosporum]PVV03335.1 hypothetical protein BB560_002196 [Smittium megazygosporum]